MFYFDEVIRKFEKGYCWDKALIHLEKIYVNQPDVNIINSLVGFSWYYLIEGPVDSHQFSQDSNELALDIWKKYINIGLTKYKNDYSFCFIAGYTLLLHGFYIKEYQNNYESVGINLLQTASITDDPNLKQLVDCILKMQMQKKYKPLKIDSTVLDNLFDETPLLKKYFEEIFT